MGVVDLCTSLTKLSLRVVNCLDTLVRAEDQGSYLGNKTTTLHVHCTKNNIGVDFSCANQTAFNAGAVPLYLKKGTSM